MKAKWDFPRFWEAATKSAYSEAACKIRIRLASATGLIPAGRRALSDLDKARLFLVLYASTSHLDAADAARRLAILDSPVQQGGCSDTRRPRAGTHFEDILAGLIWAARNGGNDLAGISICTSHPQVDLCFTGADGGVEEYRYCSEAPAVRFSTGRAFTDVPAHQIEALSGFGFEGFH